MLNRLIIYFRIQQITQYYYQSILQQRTSYWAALSLSFRLISILLMNIIAWGPQVTNKYSIFVKLGMSCRRNKGRTEYCWKSSSFWKEADPDDSL